MAWTTTIEEPHVKPAVLLALLLAAPVAAQTGLPSGISDISLKADTAMLASDAFEGRRPGTPGGDKAVAYIMQRMQAMGLQPGNHGNWTQDVPLVTITTAPTPLTLAGGAAPLSLAYGTDVVLWTKRQVATQALTDSPVVFVGYGITAPEADWDDYAGLDVHGKTVVFLVNDPDWQTPAAGKDAGPFEGRAMTYYGRYTYKFEEAARHGAAAAFVIHDTEPAGYGWNVITTSWTGPQIDLDSPDKGIGRVGVEGWITKAAFERTLAAAADKDLATLTKAAQIKGFRAVPLGLAASAKLTNTIAHLASKNVIGIIPGTKRPNETVFFTAHWDHLGRCPADKSGDDICNGAVDNASGDAGLLALAGAFAKGPKPERTVVFMAVTGEESGFLGSRWYAEHPVYPLALTAGGINMDVMNVGGRTRDIVLRGDRRSSLDDLLGALAKAQGRTIALESNPEKGGYFRSDHFSFAKLGVPVTSAGSGIDRRDGGKTVGQAAADDYIAHRYHQPSDNYDPKWNWSGAVEDLDLYYAAGRKLADEAGLWPTWNDGNAFKALRDTTAAQRLPYRP
jgi:Zn-dependent M28 family amino/carboxypeptidase